MHVVPDFDFGHGETIGQLRDSVASFCAKELAPRAAEIDRKNEFPRDLWPRLGDLGVLGMTVPPEYGGVDGTLYRAYAKRVTDSQTNSEVAQKFIVKYDLDPEVLEGDGAFYQLTAALD